MKRLALSALVFLVSSIPALAQTKEMPRWTHGEITGLGGGSGYFVIGSGSAADALWGLKAGGFGGSRGRFGVEGGFEQSIREAGFRFAGGDFVAQFPPNGRRRVVPFVHAGIGAFLYGSEARPALSFGGGIKLPLSRHFGVRFGVQDRMWLRDARLHRLDLYGGVFFRF